MSIIDRDYAMLAIAGGLLGLQPFQAMLVDTLNIPGRFGQRALEAGLISRGREFPIDATHGLVLGNQQAGHGGGEMPTRWLIREEIAKLDEQLFHHLRDNDNSGHSELPSHAQP